MNTTKLLVVWALLLGALTTFAQKKYDKDNWFLQAGKGPYYPWGASYSGGNSEVDGMALCLSPDNQHVYAIYREIASGVSFDHISDSGDQLIAGLHDNYGLGTLPGTHIVIAQYTTDGKLVRYGMPLGIEYTDRYHMSIAVNNAGEVFISGSSHGGVYTNYPYNHSCQGVALVQDCGKYNMPFFANYRSFVIKVDNTLNNLEWIWGWNWNEEHTYNRVIADIQLADDKIFVAGTKSPLGIMGSHNAPFYQSPFSYYPYPSPGPDTSITGEGFVASLNQADASLNWIHESRDLLPNDISLNGNKDMLCVVGDNVNYNSHSSPAPGYQGFAQLYSKSGTSQPARFFKTLSIHPDSSSDVDMRFVLPWKQEGFFITGQFVGKLIVPFRKPGAFGVVSQTFTSDTRSGFGVYVNKRLQGTQGFLVKGRSQFYGAHHSNGEYVISGDYDNTLAFHDLSSPNPISVLHNLDAEKMTKPFTLALNDNMAGVGFQQFTAYNIPSGPDIRDIIHANDAVVWNTPGSTKPSYFTIGSINGLGITLDIPNHTSYNGTNYIVEKHDTALDFHWFRNNAFLWKHTDPLFHQIRKNEVEPALTGLSIHPNPLAGNVLFVRGAYTKATVQVFDLNGRLVTNSQISDVKRSIELPDISPGTYLVELIREDGRRDLQKLIVQ